MSVRRMPVRLIGAMAALAFALGCQQQMAVQPSYKPLSASDYFVDGQTARQPVDGTLPQGRAEFDPLYVASDSMTFPLPLTADLVSRGKERYGIFCTPCHGQIGDGNGFVTTRGFLRPPTFHSDHLRNAPVGHFFDVITNGFGTAGISPACPGFAAQISPRDRWAIIAYVRALQLSQNVPAAQLTPDQRAQIGEGGAPR